MNDIETIVLPKFNKPPVNEVVAGIQFSSNNFLPTVFGLFYSKIKTEYPTVIPQLPLPPSMEISPPGVIPSFSFPQFLAPSAQQRVWFQTEDDTKLIQLQSDRIIFNWRKQPGHVYDSFSVVRDGFSSAFTILENLMEEAGLGTIIPNQCEVSYINPFEAELAVPPGHPERAVRAWNPILGTEWTSPLEDLSFNARYRLLSEDGNSFGRLISTLSTVPTPSGETMLRLDQTARGIPLGPGLDGVLAFFEQAHQAIVRHFSAITTEDMHRVWDRTQ